jgi:K+-sensing histidine kinase KdpD
MAVAMSVFGHAAEHQVSQQAEDGPQDGFGEYGAGVTCAAAVMLILAIAAIDKLTGVELRLQMFYLIPVSMVTWVAGRSWGLLFSVGAVASWVLMFGATHTYSANFYFYWDAVVSLVTLIAFVLVLSRLRSALDALGAAAALDKKK